MKLEIKELSLRDWPRRDVYLYFTQMRPTILNLTVEVDVTKTVKYSKENELSFFAISLWLICKVVNEIPEFRYAYSKEKKLLQYNHILPIFPVFHEDTKSITTACVDTCQDFDDFYCEFKEQVEIAKHSKKFVTSKYPYPPANIFNISAEPRIHFNSLSMLYPMDKESTFFYPLIVMGKFINNGERYTMPLSIQISHAVTDGYHISVFFETIQKYFSDPSNYIHR